MSLELDNLLESSTPREQCQSEQYQLEQCQLVIDKIKFDRMKCGDRKKRFKFYVNANEI